MSNVTSLRPIRWDRLRADEAQRVIRQRCQIDGTANVVFTEHAWDRVSERDITRLDVFDILRFGECDEPRKNERGAWQVIVSGRRKGSREAGIVTVIVENEEKLIIRTVQWMDVR